MNKNTMYILIAAGIYLLYSRKRDAASANAMNLNSSQFEAFANDIEAKWNISREQISQFVSYGGDLSDLLVSGWTALWDQIGNLFGNSDNSPIYLP